MAKVSQFGRDLGKCFEHPKQKFGVHLVRQQYELKGIFANVKTVLDKYPEFKSDKLPDYRANFGKFRKAFESGLLSDEDTEVLTKLKDRFISVTKEQFAVPVMARLHGVELSAAGKPMRTDNVCVDTISEAVAKAKENNMLVVSRNVFGQLTSKQQEELCQVDGAHALSEFSHMRPKHTNPFGKWEHNVPELPASPIVGGNVYWNVSEREVEKMELVKVSDPYDQPFVITPELAEEFSLPAEGTYNLTSGGLQYVGKEKIGSTILSSAGLSRKLKPGPYDSVGMHSPPNLERPIHFPVTKKFDGEFAEMKISGGKVKVKTRSGIGYEGDVNFPDTTLAFEFGEGWYRVLYFKSLKGVPLPLHYSVQTYLRKKLRLGIIALDDKKLFWGGPDPGSDGVVIHSGPQHWFLKNEVTVDLTFHFFKKKLEPEGYVLKGTRPFPGVAEFAIKGKELIFRRHRPDKYIGNKYESFKRLESAKSLNQIKAIHNEKTKCYCSICDF